MNLSDFDLSVIKQRSDGSFVVNQGTYHVPNEGEWADLWLSLKKYLEENPDIEVQEDFGIIDIIDEQDPITKALNLLEAAAKKYISQNYPFTDDQYATLLAGNIYPIFNEFTEYSIGELIVYNNKLYKIIAISNNIDDNISLYSVNTLDTSLDIKISSYTLSLIYDPSL